MTAVTQPKSRILIVDDVPKNIQVVASILKEEGFQMAFAQSGRSALEQARAAGFDLILLDIMMPEMDGFEVCRQLKDDDALKDIPVIFLSAKTDSDSTVRGLQMGAVDYVSKPFNSAELLARVRTHLELKHARERLQEMNAAKNKFFSIIAHDLRNPVGALRNMAELLMEKFDTADEEKKRSWVVMLHESTERLCSLLENLLQWSRVQTGRMPCRPESLPVAALVASALSLARIPADQKKVRLSADALSASSVLADKIMAETVVRNLLSNAVKFTPEGGSVQVATRDNGTRVEIAVSDTGVGIGPEDCKKIFRIDSQHTTPGTAGERGTGLGLVLCREFVEQNGGTIRVESKEGTGSTFYVSLPKAT